MICKKCRKDIPDESTFCLYCGAKQTAPKATKRGNGTGSVYKQGNTWTAVVSVGRYLGADGEAHRVRRKKTGFATKKEALAYLPELAAQQGSKNPDADITYKDMFDRWCAEHEKDTGYSTIGNYKSAMNHYKKLWHMPVRAIGVDDLQECIDTCTAGKRTKQLMQSVVHQLFRYAYDRNVIDKLPPKLSAGHDAQKHRPAFTPAQIELIRQQIGTVPMAEYVYCLIYLGFRPGEMLFLTRDSYHTEDGISYFVGGGKTAAGTNRRVVISQKIVSYIKPLVLSAKPYVFSTPEGRQMSDAYFRNRVFYPVLAAAGIQPIPDAEHEPVYVPYCCRHTCATLMKNVSGSLKDKGAILGHSNATMTMHYQDSDLESLRKIADAL